MKKKRNIIKRNSGFLVGCVLAAGASFFTADTLIERGMPILEPSTEPIQTETVKPIEEETQQTGSYETDAFTVTASGNILKGVETELPAQTDTEMPDTDENGSQSGSGENSVGSGSYGDGASDGSGSYSGDSSYSDGSYSDGNNYSSGNSGGSGGTYYEQPIEIYSPGNGEYSYTDGNNNSSWSSSSVGNSSTGSSSESGSSENNSSEGNSSVGSSSPGTPMTTPDDVILWGISSRYIDESELYNYSSAQLRLIRNEIFALHGRIFISQDLKDYFSQKSWYVPMYAPEDFDANMFYYLNDYEEANLNVILNYEAALAGN